MGFADLFADHIFFGFERSIGFDINGIETNPGTFHLIVDIRKHGGTADDGKINGISEGKL